MSTDGPEHNVIKIKPPMCFSMADADELAQKLDMMLLEIDGAADEIATEMVCEKASHDSAASLVDQSATPATRCILTSAS